jgi:FkbM family methyltransferase
MHIKEHLKSIRANLIGLDPGVLKFYYKSAYSPKPQTLAHKLDQLSKGKKPFYFFQIGGNDGFANDPIFKFIKRDSWKGIIVEPQKDVFEKRLKRTYRFERNVILENVAIAKENGSRKLYKIAISNSRWATGLSTFDKEVLEKQIETERVKTKAKKERVTLPNTPENWITHEDVECTTIDNLLSKYKFSTLDLLQIDTEGFDFEIIKMIDFNKMKPSIICFEHTHMNEESIQECDELLSKHAYSVERIGGDSIATLEK